MSQETAGSLLEWLQDVEEVGELERISGEHWDSELWAIDSVAPCPSSFVTGYVPSWIPGELIGIELKCKQ